MADTIKYKGELYKRIDNDSETLIKLLSSARKSLDGALKLSKNHIEARSKELDGLENRLKSKTIDIDGATIKYVHSLVGKVESLVRELKHLS